MHKIDISFIYPGNTSRNSYTGVKLRYKRIPADTCISNHKSLHFDVEIQSPGYPNNYQANLTCEYYIDVYKKKNFIQIGFIDMSFGPNDVFTMYDTNDNSILLGPLTGPRDGIQMNSTNSSSVRIVVNASSTSNGVRKYAFVFREVLQGTCVKEYYSDVGVEQRVSSARETCLHVVRSKKDTFLRLWFESLVISPENFVVVTLRSSRGKIDTWNLTSNDLGHYRRNFEALEKGNWFEIEQTKNVSFDLRFMSYSSGMCPFYKESESFESGFSSPGYPDNLPSNSSCEFYFTAQDETKVVSLKFKELLLSPGDLVTIYDPTRNSIIAKYYRTEQLLVSVKSKGGAIRVVVNTSGNQTTVGRRFLLDHKALSPDVCLIEYVGRAGQFSSVNRSCEFNIFYSAAIELTFKNIKVPENGTIEVFQRTKYPVRNEILGTIKSEDSGTTKYFRNTGGTSGERLISIRTNGASVMFRLNFKPFVSDRIVTLGGSNGTLCSPYYPETYLRGIMQIYHVIVPNGHVMLNFTEMQLTSGRFFNDLVTIYDGNTTSEKGKLGGFEGGTPSVVPAWFLSSSNIITVKFACVEDDALRRKNRFKASYVTKTQVKYCDALKWPNTHPERNLTLPGRTTKYFCNKNYLNPDYKNIFKWVERKCNFGGDWNQGDTLICKRICPRLDEKLKENSTLRWSYSFTYARAPHDGTNVRFTCGFGWELTGGPEIITCTSHGNYSAFPPTCKKLPDRKKNEGSSSNAWKYGVGFGSTAFIIAIVIAVLRGCFGCCSVCESKTASSSIQLESMSTT
ncbi:uncharacterized protein LOC114523477 isoform X2 [Dendronephthya gigantea]|uniref:uncharacterized protein LOC114523477 isoform X2 n=1 Tax=Dendronephthya gigantea TaxID=151771 RepID=UPI00106D82BD|nr:uncharacterized protein LOC114523477 isoform X2 [Dendronephthya gigantea]